jgi:hypothetical protein
MERDEGCGRTSRQRIERDLRGKFLVPRLASVNRLTLKSQRNPMQEASNSILSVRNVDRLRA